MLLRFSHSVVRSTAVLNRCRHSILPRSQRFATQSNDIEDVNFSQRKRMSIHDYQKLAKSQQDQLVRDPAFELFDEDEDKSDAEIEAEQMAEEEEIKAQEEERRANAIKKTEIELDRMTPEAREMYFTTKSQMRPKQTYIPDMSRQTRSTVSDPHSDETSSATAFDPVTDSFFVPTIDVAKWVKEADGDAFPFPPHAPGTEGHGYRPLPYSYVARRAGSMVDVFKHTVLTQLIDAHQVAYGESWTFVDFKAGPVAINIERSVNRPWGVDAAFEYGKWWARLGRKYSQTTRHALVPFMHVTRLVNSREQSHIDPVDADALPGRLDRGFPLYPGTPAIVRNMMRSRDRAIFFEPDRSYRRHIIDYFNNDDPTRIPELNPLAYQVRDDVAYVRELDTEIREKEEARLLKEKKNNDMDEEDGERMSLADMAEMYRKKAEDKKMAQELAESAKSDVVFNIDAEVDTVKATADARAEVSSKSAEAEDEFANDAENDELVQDDECSEESALAKEEAKKSTKELQASLNEVREDIRSASVDESTKMELLEFTDALEQSHVDESDETNIRSHVVLSEDGPVIDANIDGITEALEDAGEVTPETFMEPWFANEEQVFPDQKAWPVADPVEDAMDDPLLQDSRIRVYPYDVYSDNNSFDVIGALAQPTTAHGLLHIDLTTHDRFEAVHHKLDQLGKTILPKFSKQFPHATIMCSIPMYGGVLPLDHARHFVKLGYKDVMYTSRVCQGYLEQGTDEVDFDSLPEDPAAKKHDKHDKRDKRDKWDKSDEGENDEEDIDPSAYEWNEAMRDERGLSKLFSPGGGQILINEDEPWGVACIIARPPIGFYSRSQDVCDTIDDADSKIGYFDVQSFGCEEVDEIIWRSETDDNTLIDWVEKKITLAPPQPESAYLTKHWTYNKHEDHAFEQDWDVPLKRSLDAKHVSLHQLNRQHQSALEDERRPETMKYYNEAQLWDRVARGPETKLDQHKRMLQNTKRRQDLIISNKERETQRMARRLGEPLDQEVAKATKIQQNEAKTLQAWKNAVKAIKHQNAL